jgi:hypothetical protein
MIIAAIGIAAVVIGALTYAAIWAERKFRRIERDIAGKEWW